MFASLKLFWRRMGKLKVPYLLSYILSTAVILVALAATKYTGMMIDLFLTEGSPYTPKESAGSFILWLCFLAGLTVVKDVMRYIQMLLLENGSQNILYNVRNELYDKLQNLDINFYTHNTTGDMMSRLTGDIDLIRHMFSWIIYSAYEAVLMFVGSFVVLITINPWLTLLMLICLPFIVILNYKMSKALRPQHQLNREQGTILSTRAKENITGNRVVKAFVREAYERDRMTSENRKMTDRNKITHKTWLKYSVPINLLCNMLGIIGLFGGAVFCIIDPEFTIGDLTIFTGMTWALNYPMLISGTIINDLQRYSASVDKIVALMHIGSAIKEKENAVVLSDKIDTIEFCDVSLTIDGMNILRNINLKINGGESIGIMGPTGSGKSMLVGMLARFYDPTEGAIYINGVDIRDYNLSSLRRKFGYSHQDVFLYSNTIEGNIAFSDPDMPSERVYDCAKVADADGFIRGTVNGYDTIIGERGIGLSGGQKQRIALARAIATDGEVIILDDTTSAVDLETEKKIQESLALLTERTKIIIAQRITSVYKCNRIIVIEKGTVSENGTHRELKNAGGYYSRVFHIQHGTGSEVKD